MSATNRRRYAPASVDELPGTDRNEPDRAVNAPHETAHRDDPRIVEGHSGVRTGAGANRWRVEAGDQLRLVVHLARWIALGAASGALAGLASFVFLDGLDRVTRVRVAHGWLLFLLPAAGLAVGVLHERLGGRATQGTSLLLAEIHEPTAWVPRRMAPLVLVGTWVTHLVGGSAGREGAAVQMSGSLSDGLARLLRLRSGDRRLLLVAAMSAGFGAVFGVPLAGAVFGLEVQTVGRVRYEAIVPALTGSLVGDVVVRGLGYHHTARAAVAAGTGVALLAKVALAGLAFGLTSTAFVELTGLVKRLARRVTQPALRPAVGGVAVVGLAALFGRDYLGLSLPLLDRAVAGQHVVWWAFALKLAFTAVTLGCGFPGGEVTPLLVVGATLGAALAGPLGLPVAVLAAVGMVAVFAAAANTPLACTIMGVELFGSGALLPMAVGCVAAYVLSSHRGIYDAQRIAASKGPNPIDGRPTLRTWSTRRRDDT